MALNLWECDYLGVCTSTAAGVGGAAGLAAIGWYFAPGPIIRCPNHRPDPIPCRDSDRGGPCSPCAGETEANMIQHAIVRHTEDIRAWYATHLLAESKER